MNAEHQPKVANDDVISCSRSNLRKFLMACAFLFIFSIVALLSLSSGNTQQVTRISAPVSLGDDSPPEALVAPTATRKAVATNAPNKRILDESEPLREEREEKNKKGEGEVEKNANGSEQQKGNTVVVKDAAVHSDGGENKAVVEGEKKSNAGGGNKCLVIISMNSCQRQRSVPEWSNIPHILSHAYIPANTPTAMFDSVDFLFVTNTGSLGPEELKLSKEAESSNKPIFRDIPNVPNARLVVTGKASSDLSMVQQLYQHVTQDPAVTRYIVLNTGTRGPLVPPEYVVDGNGIKSADGASRYYWVDVAGGAKLVEHMRDVVKIGDEGVRNAETSLGKEKNNGQPNYDNLVVGSLISMEVKQHLQSYFLSLPPRAFRVYFGAQFDSHDKMAVIINIEVGTPQVLHEKGFAIYSMGQGLTWEAARRLHDRTNPAYTSKCARCCLFAKHGGGMWKLQTNEFITELESLTLSMRSHRDAMTIPKLDDASFGQALRQHEAVRHIERMLQRYWCYDASSTYFQPRSAVDRNENV